VAKRKTPVVIWHNAKCSTSRTAMCVLDEMKATATVVNYLDDEITEPMLEDLLTKLGIPAFELVRTKEPLYKEKFAYRKLSEKQWIKALIKHPVLIERPVVVKGNKAVIGRPMENIINLLKK
jgi:arsenate reductase (glutaredoxin)